MGRAPLPMAARGALVAASLLVAWAGVGPATAEDGPAVSPAAGYAADEQALRRGRLLFNGTCGGYCHSTTPGNREAPFLFDCTWVHGDSDDAIFATIARGVPGTQMPGWQGKMPQGDDDLWRIVAYLRSVQTCG